MVIKQILKNIIVVVAVAMVFSVSAARKKLVGKKAEELLTASVVSDEGEELPTVTDETLVDDQELLNKGSLKDLSLKSDDTELLLEDLTAQNDQSPLSLGDDQMGDPAEFEKMMNEMMENPEAVKQMEAMMQDPEVIAQVDAMMKDPEAMKQMEEMMKAMESGKGLDFSGLMGDQVAADQAA